MYGLQSQLVGNYQYKRQITTIRERRKAEMLNRDTIFVVLLLALFLVMQLLDMSLFEVDSRIGQIVRYSGYGLMLVTLTMKKFNNNNLTKLLLWFGIVGLGFVFNRNLSVVLYSVVIASCLFVQAELVLKTYMVVQSTMLFVIVFASQQGWLLDFIWKQSGRTRHFLGFTYTTFAPILFLFVILEYLYLKKGKINLIEYLIGMGMSIWLYKLTDTTFAFLVSIGVLTFFLITQFWLDKGYITYTFRWFFYLLPWICAGVSIWASWAFNSNNEVWLKIDSLTHGRLRLGNVAIKEYDFSLFGRNIEWIGSSIEKLNPNNYNYVDCSYVQIILQEGMIFLAIVLVVYSLSFALCIRNKSYFAVYLLSAILGFSMTEPRLWNIVFNGIFVVSIIATMRLSIIKGTGKMLSKID